MESGLTHAERTLTQAERAQSHAERTLTQAERAQSHAERTLNHAERTVTHAERTVTDAERTVTHAERTRATHRGLNFLYQTSLDDRTFDEWSGDFLWCFYSISATAKEAGLRQMASTMGAHAAQRWHARELAAPELDDAGEVAYYVALADVTRRLGVADGRFRERLQERSVQFPARAYLGFDPRTEPPPCDLPEVCKSCETKAPRGAARCACGMALRWRSRYDVWSDALVSTYTGDGFGVPLGAPYSAVLRWLPAMRPYRGYEDGTNAEFRDIAFAITHLVYTLNDYNRRQLAPDWLPEEFEFLMTNAKATQAAGDTELLGEFVDSLRAFGVPESDPCIRSGIEYLLDAQNADGSWGDPRGLDTNDLHANDPDICRRCHTTWTAVDGLRDFDWSDAAAPPVALTRLWANEGAPAVTRR